jgi:lipoyl(octanoyl) transferase
MQRSTEITYENSLEKGAPSWLRLFGIQNIAELDIVLHSEHSPQANMDFDHNRALEFAHSFATDFAAGNARPMLRLYSWKPHAVSLGAHQRLSDIDEEACQRHGYAIVRRPTGGRAILHANELTYSCVLPLTTSTEPTRNVHDIYRYVHLLQNLGAREIAFQKSQTDFRALYRNERRSGQVSMPCFASSARYELMLHGRKVVGSAQRLYGNTVLQHGSILLGKGHECLADVLRLPSDDERDKVRSVIQAQSATVEESLGRAVTWDEVAREVLAIFR